jgi:uncharacterized membrane protein YidH (DUF202 family)
MPRPTVPDRQQQFIQFVLVLLGIVMTAIGWLRWARLA